MGATDFRTMTWGQIKSRESFGSGEMEALFCVWCPDIQVSKPFAMHLIPSARPSPCRVDRLAWRGALAGNYSLPPMGSVCLHGRQQLTWLLV